MIALLMSQGLPHPPSLGLCFDCGILTTRQFIASVLIKKKS